MFTIRPVSDLRNKFSEIEEAVKTGEPVYLTKNGYGSMVVVSIEKYSELLEQKEKLSNTELLSIAKRFADDYNQAFTELSKCDI